MCLGVFLPVWNSEASQSFLDILDYFINLFLGREVFNYYVFKYFLRSFLSLFSLLVQFSSITQSCPTPCDPMDCNMPGFPVYYQSQSFTETHAHRVGDAIQTSHPLSSPSPPTFNLPQNQGLFKLASSSHQVAKVLAFQLQHQSFQ